MMTFLRHYSQKIRSNFTTVDLGLLKLYGALFGIVLGAFFPEFVLRNLTVFISAFILLLIRFLYLLLKPGLGNQEIS